MPKRTNDGLKKRCGCGRTRWPKCKHPWYFSLYHGDREYRYSLDGIARARGEQPPVGKLEAESWRDKLRTEIRNGTFSDPGASPIQTQGAPSTVVAAPTLSDVADQYLKKHVCQPDRREGGRKIMEWHVEVLKRVKVPDEQGMLVPLGGKPIDRITKADIEAVRDGWSFRTTGAKGGRTGPDRTLKRLRHLFNWAVENDLARATPFRREGVVVIHFKKEAPRTRRLEAGEERKLLKATQTNGAWMYALIVAALETGCRVGELLSLRWREVRLDQNVLLLRESVTKTAEARDVPVSQRLRSLLEMRRTSPTGRKPPPDWFVFGNEVGERSKGISDRWRRACRAAGIEDLHFHDLRREFASRLAESGLPLHAIGEWLGHANISQTSTYLKTTRVGLQKYLKQFEKHRTAASRVAAKSNSIRTPFAQAVDSNSSEQPSAVSRNRSKSLN